MIKTDDQQSLNEIDQEKSYTLHQSQPIPPRLKSKTKRHASYIHLKSNL
jgi:hypothetical protein